MLRLELFSPFMYTVWFTVVLLPALPKVRVMPVPATSVGSFSTFESKGSSFVSLLVTVVMTFRGLLEEVNFSYTRS